MAIELPDIVRFDCGICGELMEAERREWRDFDGAPSQTSSVAWALEAC